MEAPAGFVILADPSAGDRYVADEQGLLGTLAGLFSIMSRVVLPAAAGQLGVTQPTASLWLGLLVDKGIITVAGPGGGFRGGRRMAREYRIAGGSGEQ